MADPFLEISDLNPDPVGQFASWYAEARMHTTGLPHAMNLATVDKRGRPVARMVLLDDFGPQGFSFYSNYQSRKAREITTTPYAALVFYWQELSRQVRIEGRVEKVSEAQSDAYFAKRPRESQLGAWASPQSAQIEDRRELADRIEELSERFGEGDIPRPPHWGGYLVQPDRFEFWASRPGRLHDRFAYESETNSGWTITQLAP